MRNTLEASDEADPRRFRPVAPVFQAASDHEAPAPLQMFAGLGVLLAIALGVGLIAQILARVPF